MPTAPSFDDLLRSASTSAVHLEMRDAYGVSGEAAAFAAWKADGTRDTDPDSPYWSSWTSLIREITGRGAVVRRARIVSEPVTDYIKFEHAGTSVVIEAGESVRWLPRRRASGIALPGNDFWLIDGRAVRFNHFTGDGDAAEPEYTEDPAVAKLCADAFEAVWSAAVPHGEYRV